MSKVQFSELSAFITIAEQHSFTKAAAAIGVGTPTLSEAVRSLEEKLGLRLLNRTTRNVSVTEAGEQLLARLRPLMDGIDDAINSVNAFRETPRGTLRLHVGRPIAKGLLLPILPQFLEKYPEIVLEIVLDDTLSDLVSSRCDAGIQIGERIEKDMIAVRLRGPFETAAVASPAYLARHGAPARPEDLRHHNCIRWRSPWDGAIQPWRFTRGGEHVDVAVGGSLILNEGDMIVRAAVSGIGVSYLPIPFIARYLADGRLVRVLEDWGQTWSGVYIYYTSRRQPPAALTAFIAFMGEITPGLGHA